MGEIHVGILAKRTARELNESIQVSFKDLFKSLSKGALSVPFQDWKGAAHEAVSAVSTVKLGDDPGQRVWLLIHAALTQAVWELVGGNFGLLSRRREDFDGFCEEIGNLLDEHLIVIDKEFFSRPGEAAFVRRFGEGLEKWLREWGFDESEASSAADRLPSYFTFALNDRWRADAESLVSIQSAIDTPFTRAGEKELGWFRYTAWLNRDEPVFEEAFSLRQIYVPLRAYFREKGDQVDENFLSEDLKNGEKRSRRIVVDLEDSIDAWLTKADRRDAIRVIEGGPGSGKTSFVKLFAGKKAKEGKTRVLFVPLHQLELGESLIKAIGEFVRYNEFLGANPLDPEEAEERLLLVLDGLDELSKQGTVGGQIAQEVVREIEREVDRFNMSTTRLQVLICGRPVAVAECASHLREPGQVLYVLPYLLPEDEDGFEDPDELLNGVHADQRQQWWRQYGTLTGKAYEGMPEELERDELEEISSQPLLNYLLALSHSRGAVSFGASETNRNIIYEDLIGAVYNRKKWAGVQHPSLEGLDYSSFLRVLEEIALAVWHGDGRTATIKEIQEHCNGTGVGQLLAQFQKGAEAGVARLLTAFYFRRVGARDDGDKTFEFTHKSFGEYLTARRVLRAADQMARELARRSEDPDSGWDPREALFRWVRVCGPAALDEDIARFLIDESTNTDEKVLSDRHAACCVTIGHRLRHGMPMERIEAAPSF